VLGLAILAVLAAAAYAGHNRPIAALGDAAVVARTVLVLRDVSGSMDGTEAALATQTQAALAAGVRVAADVRTVGFGMSPAGDPGNALRTLERVLRHVEADAVYVFSDFDNQTGSYDDADAEGLARLEALLVAERMRLYLATVRLDPDPRLVEIATASGGGVIRAAGR
jgi:hypothetical protein